jgi:hypothetical protein
MSDFVQSVRDAAKTHPGHRAMRRATLNAALMVVLACLALSVSPAIGLALAAISRCSLRGPRGRCEPR